MAFPCRNSRRGASLRCVVLLVTTLGFATPSSTAAFPVPLPVPLPIYDAAKHLALIGKISNYLLIISTALIAERQLGLQIEQVRNINTESVAGNHTLTDQIQTETDSLREFEETALLHHEMQALADLRLEETQQHLKSISQPRHLPAAGWTGSHPAPLPLLSEALQAAEPLDAPFPMTGLAIQSTNEQHKALDTLMRTSLSGMNAAQDGLLWAKDMEEQLKELARHAGQSQDLKESFDLSGLIEAHVGQILAQDTHLQAISESTAATEILVKARDSVASRYNKTTKIYEASE
jgi:hypothetical protein